MIWAMSQNRRACLEGGIGNVDQIVKQKRVIIRSVEFGCDWEERYWLMNKMYHRDDDGPASEFKYGECSWYRRGKFIRSNKQWQELHGPRDY